MTVRTDKLNTFMKKMRQWPLLGAVVLSLGLAACGSNSEDDADTSGEMPETETETGDETDTLDSAGLDLSLFAVEALASVPEIVDCTLSDGTESSCYEIVTVGAPTTHQVGPFCPTNVTSVVDDSEVGIWFDGSGIVYELNGDFIVDLPNIYGDNRWQLFEQTTGRVFVTDTQIACEAASRPDVDPEFQNHCVECSLEYYNGGISSTILIPTTPVAADVIGTLGARAGLALTGIPLEGPAPVADALANFTIAAFDDCGGHVDPVVGYHYHAATGCVEIDSEDDGHAGLIGYALDGFPIYGELDAEGNESEGLDECRGSTDEVRGYHYHAASPSENLFIGCYTGLTVEGATGGEREPPPGDRPLG